MERFCFVILIWKEKKIDDCRNEVLFFCFNIFLVYEEEEEEIEEVNLKRDRRWWGNFFFFFFERGIDIKDSIVERRSRIEKLSFFM